MGLYATNLLAMAGVVAFLLLLRNTANRPARRDPDTGELVLQCSSVLVWVMGLLAVGGSLGMALLALLVPFQSDAEIFVPIVLGSFFLLVGGFVSYWAVARRTRVGEQGLTSEYLFVKPRFLPWHEVKSLSFASGLEFWVRGQRHKAMLHVWFVGVKEAVPILEQHLPEKVLKSDQAVLDRFARTTGA